MKKLILSILLLLTFATTAASKGVIHTAIAPLSLFKHGIICTTWSVNQAKHYWVTANHCVKTEGTYSIQGDPAWVVDTFEDDDLVVLKSRDESSALTISDTAPSFGDTVYTSGHPFGNIVMIPSEGKVMAPLALVPVSEGFFEPEVVHKYALFTMPVLPGHSGAPVINSKGEVVSVVQIGASVISGGVPYDRLLKDLKKYRPK